MATFAIGDIHGNALALEDLLGQIRREAVADDDVVFLGDYIDRGPDAKACVEAILAFQAAVAARVVCLCGNHEDWLLRTLNDFTRHSWLLGMEATDTVRSYSPEAALALRDAASDAGLELVIGRVSLPYDRFFSVVPDSHLQFFKNLASSHRTADGLCSHGGVNPRVPRVEEQSREDLMWGAQGFPEEYVGAETVVYGHWNNADIGADGWPSPRIVGRTIGIDTSAHGVLTAIRLPDQRVFQSARYAAEDSGV